jgi:hypothetical protein
VQLPTGWPRGKTSVTQQQCLSMQLEMQLLGESMDDRELHISLASRIRWPGAPTAKDSCHLQASSASTSELSTPVPACNIPSGLVDTPSGYYRGVFGLVGVVRVVTRTHCGLHHTDTLCCVACW